MYMSIYDVCVYVCVCVFCLYLHTDCISIYPLVVKRGNGKSLANASL